MIPTAFSQVLEQIVNAAVSIMGAYFLLKLAKAAKKGENYSLAMAAVGGTLGTVAGAVFASVFDVRLCGVPEGHETAAAQGPHAEEGELRAYFPCAFIYHCPRPSKLDSI